MKYLLDSKEMRKCDENTMQRRGMPSAVLMERAALACAEEIVKARPNPDISVLVACGTGNNGGDGLAVARLLYLKGYSVDILFPGKEEKSSVEAKRQLGIVKNYEIPVYTELPDKTYDVIVDALFGIGLSRNIEGKYAELICRMNEMSGYKVAVDISSGLSADDGSVMGVAFQADITVTFGFAKTGHILYPGAELSGRVLVKDIGIDEKSLFEIHPGTGALEVSDLSLLPLRSPYSNKGSYGKILILAGSYNMAGAAAFSAKAAYASGAGLVRVATPRENRQIIQNLVPEAVLSTYREDTDMESYVKELLSWADTVVAGPGIGISKQAKKMVHTVLKYAKIPCVLDADALNIVANHREWLLESSAQIIVTPHLGEMARLCGLSVQEIQKNMIATARTFSDTYHVTCVLKDARTIISLEDGFSYINMSGNHGMATAGAGDVLTGIIGTFLGQKLSPETAAPLGVFVHGMAGDCASRQVGKRGLMASDIVAGIREVLKRS